MSGVIVVDAESFWSTCLGHDAYIHDHYLDMLITMLNSINFSTVICSPTVILTLSWEKPLLKPMAPRSIFHHISFRSTILVSDLLFLQSFTFRSINQKYQNIYFTFCSVSSISIRSHFCKWPWRDWQPLNALVALSYCFCVGTRDSSVASYWIDTLVLKNWGKYLRYFAASSFPLQGNPTQCSRGSKKDFWRRCRGGLRKSQHTKYPSQTLISRITLFAICLSFSSPPLYPCRFIRPFFRSPSLFRSPLFCLPLSCLCVGLFATMALPKSFDPHLRRLE